MIKISAIKPKILKKYNTVIKVQFDYNKNLVDIIKSCSVRAFNNDDKSWEVGLLDFNYLAKELESYEVDYMTNKDELLNLANNVKHKKPLLELRLDSSIKNKKADKSLFVSFSYNANLVAILKEKKSYFNSYSKSWETNFDLAFINEIINAAKNNDYSIQIDKSVKEEIYRLKELNRIIEESKNRDWDSIINNYSFKTKPYSYQLDGIKRGLQDNNLLLTDEQGLGKTLQAIYIADIKSKVEKYKHTLIVCGVNGLKYNWLSEVEEHLDEEAYILGSRVNKKGNLVEGTLKERIEALDKIANGEIDNRFIITNIETLRDVHIKEKLQKLCINNTIGMTIIDELHRISNTKSQQGSALKYLKSRNKIGLTGTPLVNKPFDLFAPLTWLGIENRSEYDFRHRYGVYVDRYGQGRSYEELIKYTNLGELKDILNTVMLRREKKDVLDLPEVVYMQETIELGKEQKKLYNSIRDELIQQIDELVLDTNPLAKFTRLRQACSCPGALDSSITKNAKYNRAVELIEDIKADGKKAIIYSNFAFAVKELDSILKDSNIKSYTVTGEEKNKKAVIDNFKADGDVLIGSIQALGTGYTITEATTIIFLDLPWTYANMIQAVDRAHRIGQKNNITVISLLAKDSVDIKMYKIVKKKQDLFEDLMEGKDIKGVNRKKLTKSLLGVK